MVDWTYRIFQPTETEAENPSQDPFHLFTFKKSEAKPEWPKIHLVGTVWYFFHVFLCFSPASQMSLVASSAIAPPPPVRWEATTPFGESYLGRVQGREGPRTLPKTLGTELTMKQLWEFMVCYGLLIDHIGINI